MANVHNLKPFKEGYDARRGSKPLGSKHISTYIREMMEDESFKYIMPDGNTVSGAPIKAILSVLMMKAIHGDLRAIDLIAKYGYGTKTNITLDVPAPVSLTSEQAEQLLRLRAGRNEKDTLDKEA